MEEERRLAFVALTRAERGLYLSEADGRNFDGSPRYPSRFLLEIDPSLLSFTEPPEEGLLQEAQNFIRHSQSLLPEEEAPILPEGQRVRHFLFGEGTVLETDRDKGAYVIQFDGWHSPQNLLPGEAGAVLKRQRTRLPATRAAFTKFPAHAAYSG